MNEKPTPATVEDAALAAQLRAVAARPDAQTDLSDPDAPETLDWSKAVQGRFHPTAGRRLVRLDDDVMAYFGAYGPGFEARINAALRSVVEREQSHRNV